VICENLVRSTHSVISTNPGLVSTIMQYLGLAKGKSSMPKKVYPVELDNNETLQNFAPIGKCFVFVLGLIRWITITIIN